MIRLLFLVFAIVSSVGSQAVASTSSTVTLKSDPQTVDDVITISDLFEVSGEAGQVALARAPAPGERVVLDPSYVRRMVREAGLNWANAGGVVRITVNRAAQIIADSEIVDLIAESLFVETGISHEITVSGARPVLAAPLDAIGQPTIISFEFDERTGLFRAELAAWPEGPAKRIGGRAIAMIDVPVLSRPIPRGEVVQADDLKWVQIARTSVRPGTILDEGSIIGMSTRRALRADGALREMDVQTPILIKRGDTTILTYRSGGLLLTAQARALENASQGERARFVNLQSNRTVEAIADGPGRASVLRPGYTH